MKIVLEVSQEEFSKNQYRLEDFGYEALQKAFNQIQQNRRGIIFKAVAEIKVIPPLPNP